MALDSVIRKGVAIANKATKSLQDKVLHVAWMGQDGYGAKLPEVRVIRRGIVEQQLRMHRLKDGREIHTKAKITFLERIPNIGATGRDEPVDPRDYFVLSDGTTGVVVDVEGMRDPGTNKPFLLEVYLGDRR
jgi:hypothetical protein